MNKEKFNKEWREVSNVTPASIKAVRVFINAHYLGKPPAIVMLCLMLRIKDIPAGCVIYSAPPQEADKRYGGKTWELARVWLLDGVPRNAETWLVAQSIRHIKRNHPEVEHLLSYADPSAGHTGVIYKAGNWLADGMTDDERKSPRCDYVDATTPKWYGFPESQNLGFIIRFGLFLWHLKSLDFHLPLRINPHGFHLGDLHGADQLRRLIGEGGVSDAERLNLFDGLFFAFSIFGQD
jgi:hypothetical protein